MIYANEHRGDYPRHVAALTNCLIKYLGVDTTDMYFHRERINMASVSKKIDFSRHIILKWGAAHSCFATTGSNR